MQFYEYFMQKYAILNHSNRITPYFSEKKERKAHTACGYLKAKLNYLFYRIILKLKILKQLLIYPVNLFKLFRASIPVLKFRIIDLI